MASSATIPWQCWEAVGFKECHAQQWEKARQACITAWPQISHQYGEFGGDLNLCIDESATIRALKNCASLCPQAAPTAEEQTTLPQDPTAIQVPARLEASDYAKIMGAVAVTGIVVWLITRRK